MIALLILVMLGIVVVAGALSSWRWVGRGAALAVLLSPIVLLLLLNAPEWWVFLTVVGVAVVLIYRRADRLAFTIAGAMIVLLIVFLAGADAFRGWNWVPPIRGEVVEAGTGKPVAGARVWMWGSRGFVGYFWGGPAGRFDGPGGIGRRAETNRKGVFHMGAYLSPYPIRRVHFLVFAPEYRARQLYAKASEAVLIGELIEASGAPDPGQDGVFWRGLFRSTIRVELQPLPVEDSSGWEAHLSTLEQVRKNEILLDEVNRYLKEGGKVTEGIAGHLFRCPGVSYLPLYSKANAIESALVCFCQGEGSGTSLCAKRAKYIQKWSVWFPCEEGSRSPSDPPPPGESQSAPGQRTR